MKIGVTAMKQFLWLPNKLIASKSDSSNKEYSPVATSHAPGIWETGSSMVTRPPARARTLELRTELLWTSLIINGL